jgi:hypothetical protein
MSQVVDAAAGYANVTLEPGPDGVIPCFIDVDASLKFPDGAGDILTEDLAATAIPVQGNTDCP